MHNRVTRTLYPAIFNFYSDRDFGHDFVCYFLCFSLLYFWNYFCKIEKNNVVAHFVVVYWNKLRDFIDKKIVFIWKDNCDDLGRLALRLDDFLSIKRFLIIAVCGMYCTSKWTTQSAGFLFGLFNYQSPLSLISSSHWICTRVCLRLVIEFKWSTLTGFANSFSFNLLSHLLL